MPLSEHEQRLLDQIERELYAEDPKFASTVRGKKLRRPSRRRRVQGIALFVIGVALLVLGVIVPVRVAEIPVVSVFGFVVMLGGALLALRAFRHQGDAEAEEEGGGKSDNKGDKGSSKKPRSSFAQRMEERFRQRFDDH